jgi:hypothetical protein
MLILFLEIFGPNLINHVAFIFTKWEKTKRAAAQRKRIGRTEA